MYKILINSYVFIFCVIFTSCNKRLDSYPDKNSVTDSTHILAHKGCGTYASFQENTLEAAIYGFTHADGIEVDVQKSKSRTLWLFHDEYLVECDGKERNRIPEKSDETIEAYVQCKGNGYSLTKLEEIFEYHRQHRLEKYISLDVKSWLPTYYSITHGYLLDLADKVVELVDKYQMEKYVMVECETAFFLTRVKKGNPNIKCFLTTFGDLEKGAMKALKANYDGLSFEYDPSNPPNSELIKKVKSKGLQLQFWTVNQKEDIYNALGYKPEFLQTDNILLQ